MDIKALYRIRKLLEALDAEPSGSDDKQATLSEQLELLIAQSAAPYQEITRVGRAFFVNTTGAVAAVVAIPTTGHLLSLYNNEPEGGRSYIVDWIAASNVVSTAVAGQAQLLANVGQVRETAPADSGLTKKSLNGTGSEDTRARSILTGTALPATTGIAANWFPYGPSVDKPGSAATPGYGLFAAVDGRIIVPPGRYFAMHVLANAVGETFQGFIAWHEKQLTLG